MTRINIRRITFTAAVAAIYASLTLIGAAVSYGPVQFRFSEVLCILPFFFPSSVIGLFLGCLIANLLSPYGILDIVAGSIATLIAASLTMQLGRINRDSFALKAMACFPPVFVNALVIGAVIAWASTGGGEAFWSAFALNGLQVGLGQSVVMYAAGLPMMMYLPKTYLFKLYYEHDI